MPVANSSSSASTSSSSYSPSPSPSSFSFPFSFPYSFPFPFPFSSSSSSSSSFLIVDVFVRVPPLLVPLVLSLLLAFVVLVPHRVVLTVVVSYCCLYSSSCAFWCSCSRALPWSCSRSCSCSCSRSLLLSYLFLVSLLWRIKQMNIIWKKTRKRKIRRDVK